MMLLLGIPSYGKTAFLLALAGKLDPKLKTEVYRDSVTDEGIYIGPLFNGLPELTMIVTRLPVVIKGFSLLHFMDPESALNVYGKANGKDEYIMATLSRTKQQDILNAIGSIYAVVFLLVVKNANVVQPVVVVGMYSPLPYAFAQKAISYFSTFMILVVF
ncbi:hypothetical protein K1719_007019 [Acacia pycnantha]|nr:hypothetical protein K1719_007019 [Acacia pycnantha]